MRFGAVILAAGLSTRMAENKLLLPLGNKKVVDHVIEAVKGSKIQECVLVTGRDSQLLTSIADDHGISRVYNEAYAQGQSTSVIAGLKALEKGCDGVFFILGDQPLITSQVLDDMMVSFESSDASILVPMSENGKGSPVLFGKEWFPQLLEITGDKGGRQIIRSNQEAVAYYQVDDQAFFLDVDTQVLYEVIQKIVRGPDR